MRLEVKRLLLTIFWLFTSKSATSDDNRDMVDNI
jgi:hypothetical protein